MIETQGDCVPTQVAGADEMSESERVRAGTGHAGIRWESLKFHLRLFYGQPAIKTAMSDATDV